MSIDVLLISTPILITVIYQVAIGKLHLWCSFPIHHRWDLEGTDEDFRSNGYCRTRQLVRDAKLNGLIESWWDNRAPRFRGFYINDLRDGIFEYCHQDGTCYQREKWVQGMEVS